MRIGVVADDITGSNDIGIMFTKSGCQAYVFPQESLRTAQEWNTIPGPHAAVIIDTNSRLDPAQVAYDKVFAVTRSLQEAGCRQFFNKTCSVFRGNIGAEFDAMLDALDREFAVIVLGFPKNGRTTVNGIHYVRGVRLEESEFRNDPIHPMRRSDLVGILQSQTKRKVGLVEYPVIDRGAEALRSRIDALRKSGEVNYVILDVRRQEDLRTIAGAVYDEPVLCGSSALAEELPEVWGMKLSLDRRIDLPRKAGLGILCVAGSLMPQTAAQVRRLVEWGAFSSELNALRLFDPQERQEEIAHQGQALAQALCKGREVIFHTPLEAEAVERERELGARRGLSKMEVSRLVSEAVGEVTALALQLSGQNRLVIAGGETSAAVCAKIGVGGMLVWKEIQPGLPSCLSLGEYPMLLVLKSGSFGTPEFLIEAIQHLKQE